MKGLFLLTQSVRMEPMVTTVFTTVAVTVWMILLATDTLVTVTQDVNRDIPTHFVTNVYKCS